MNCTFTKGTAEKYVFRFGSEDTCVIDNCKINLSCGYAVFMLDTENFILTCESDWGNFGYRWVVSERESFKELMLRIGGEYLCRKISDRNAIDWKKTRKRAIREFFNSSASKNREKIKDFLGEIKTVDENEIRFYDFVTSYAPDLFEGYFFVKDYPIQAKIIVYIFENYLKSELKKEVE